MSDLAWWTVYSVLAFSAFTLFVLAGPWVSAWQDRLMRRPSSTGWKKADLEETLPLIRNQLAEGLALSFSLDLKEIKSDVRKLRTDLERGVVKGPQK
jgi:hypothetical protein